jgi:PKHD-type hydroxylase
MSNKFDYFWLQNILNKEDIEKINNYIDKNFTKLEETEKTALDSDGISKKNSTVKIIEYGKIKHLLKNTMDAVLDLAEKQFGYIIFQPKDLDNCCLNIYSSNNLGSYDWHIDNSNSDLYDAKLTLLINVSLEKYEGGDFLLWSTNKKQIKELNTPGNMILFKSHINHKVSPVTKGERRTLVIWIFGPKFR